MTLVGVYYAGHGVMTTMTYALCNGATMPDGSLGKVSKTRYPLENRLRSLGQIPGAYVLGILDCCREYLEEAKRGSGADEVVQEGDYTNCLIWFGCPAGSGVDASSTIARDFFAQMKHVA